MEEWSTFLLFCSRMYAGNFSNKVEKDMNAGFDSNHDKTCEPPIFHLCLSWSLSHGKNIRKVLSCAARTAHELYSQPYIIFHYPEIEVSALLPLLLYNNNLADHRRCWCFHFLDIVYWKDVTPQKSTQEILLAPCIIIYIWADLLGLSLLPARQIMWRKSAWLLTFLKRSIAGDGISFRGKITEPLLSRERSITGQMSS